MEAGHSPEHGWTQLAQGGRGGGQQCPGSARAAAAAKGRGAKVRVLWIASRKELWTKGATSGDTLDPVEAARGARGAAGLLRVPEGDDAAAVLERSAWDWRR
ncbi:unnamed protein product [Prorocentrum cordatum]|uniref:Uncharacterized protein n=1 Tax=Prorocentrum cordatum TaxID=2364126 RepID=A0ABN9UVG5_9DINO|nr:unnamed protein product [Polarella glacialis]